MKKILPDTNALNRLFDGDEKILSALAEADTVLASVFVLGEIYAGFKGGTKEKQNREVIRRFLDKATVAVLEATHETAEVYAQVKSGLKKAGRPIPINDVWIAAQVLEAGAVLVTYDSHFRAIPGLRIWDELG